MTKQENRQHWYLAISLFLFILGMYLLALSILGNLLLFMIGIGLCGSAYLFNYFIGHALGWEHKRIDYEKKFGEEK